MSTIHPSTSATYYKAFHGADFVLKLSGTVFQPENEPVAQSILRAVKNFHDHGIRVLLVHGGGPQLDAALQNAPRHPQTHLRITPKSAIPIVEAERQQISEQIQRLCQNVGVQSEILVPDVFVAERIMGHGETGRIMQVHNHRIRNVLMRGEVGIAPFGGVDVNGEYLNVNADDNATEAARALRAEKLIFLTNEEGILRPGRNGKRKINFMDYHGAMMLLRERDEHGKFIVDNGMVPKLEACMRAVAGGVEQVHVLRAGGDQLLDEVLTRTGIGTVMEYYQSHRIEAAGPADLESIDELRAECSAEKYRTKRGTPYLKPLTRDELAELLPRSTVFRHRNIVVGTMYSRTLTDHPDAALIGGFAVGENHQNSQYGRMLFEDMLGRLRTEGFARAVSITAADEVKNLYTQYGAVDDGEFGDVVRESRKRFHRDEQQLVKAFVFDTARPS